MGMYMFVTKWDRERFSKVDNNPELDEIFQEARQYDNSLLISTYDIFERHFWKRNTVRTAYQIYHETHPNEEPYQAQYQLSASGEERAIVAYLYGIINGALAAERKLKKQ